MENKRTPAQVRRFCLIAAGVILLMLLFDTVGMLFPQAVSSIPILFIVFLGYLLMLAIMVCFHEVAGEYIIPRKRFLKHRAAVAILFLLVLLLKISSAEFFQFHTFWTQALLLAFTLADVLLVLRKLPTSQEQ
jgi:hypothetical protein